MIKIHLGDDALFVGKVPETCSHCNSQSLLEPETISCFSAGLFGLSASEAVIM